MLLTYCSTFSVVIQDPLSCRSNTHNSSRLTLCCLTAYSCIVSSRRNAPQYCLSLFSVYQYENMEPLIFNTMQLWEISLISEIWTYIPNHIHRNYLWQLKQKRFFHINIAFISFLLPYQLVKRNSISRKNNTMNAHIPKHMFQLVV